MLSTEHFAIKVPIPFSRDRLRIGLSTDFDALIESDVFRDEGVVEREERKCRKRRVILDGRPVLRLDLRRRGGECACDGSREWGGHRPRFGRWRRWRLWRGMTITGTFNLRYVRQDFKARQGRFEVVRCNAETEVQSLRSDVVLLSIRMMREELKTMGACIAQKV